VPPFAQPASAGSNLLQVATLSPVGATDFPPGQTQDRPGPPASQDHILLVQ